MGEKAKTKAELIQALALAIREDQNRTQVFDELAAQRLGVNLTDLRCMDILQRQGRATAGELAEAAHLTTGAVTAVVDRLDRAGYARRVRDEADRRRVRIELTEPAHRAAGEIYGPLGEAFYRALDRYTADELRLVLDVLRDGAEIRDEIFARLQSGETGQAGKSKD